MTTTTNTNITVELHSQETGKDDNKNCEISSENITTETNESSNNNQTALEILRCFVCDIKVQGRHYSLATCRTQSTRSRVIEKLGELVGERYMVVISEDDVICRSCANLMNTLDRLETEMKGVRSTILCFLERKYSLEEGELLGNSEPVKLCQPPQITKSHPPNTNSYHGRKRAAVSPGALPNDTKQKKSHAWMQCDKCRYTTQHNAFMVHHIRQHIKQKVNCDKCGMLFPGQQQQLSHCCMTRKENKKECHTKEKGIETNKSDSIEASNIEEINIDMHTKSEVLPVISLATNSHISNTMKQESVQLIRLSNPDDLQIQGIITADSSSTGHPLFVRVLQHVDIDQDHLQSQDITGTNTAPGMIKVKENYGGKQMLTLTEDGSLEMVEVACWDDVQPPDSHPDLTF